jgi:hypothetical protein
MASIREMETKTGICYEVGVSRGRGKSKVYAAFIRKLDGASGQSTGS